MSYFSVDVIKKNHPDKSNIRVKVFNLAHSSRGYSPSLWGRHGTRWGGHGDRIGAWMATFHPHPGSREGTENRAGLQDLKAQPQ